MSRSNNRKGPASTLRNRQLSNINNSISAPQPEAQPQKSLIDRMTFPDQSQQALPAKESGKRKRGETGNMDALQQQKKLRPSPSPDTPTVRDTPATRTEPVEEKTPRSIKALPKEDVASTPSAPAEGAQKVAAKKACKPVDVAKDEAVKVSNSCPSRAPNDATEVPNRPVEVAKDDAVKASSSFPSPPPSNDNSPTAKRPIPDVGAESAAGARKKQCMTDARAPTKEKTQDELRQMNDKLQKFSKRSLHAAAPVVANPELVYTYAGYDDDSIPILHSALIQRRDSPEFLNNPSVELKAKAYILLEKPGGFTAKDMGRPVKIFKSGCTRVIDDVDLYTMTDGKIYVATEQGLLLAADYLKLAGIADTTRVRFQGLKPAWVKASAARRFTKKVWTSTFDPDVPERENPFLPLPEGDLGLLRGAPVQVYEQHPTNGRAFGRRVDNDLLGWFDYENLTDMYAPFPQEDWEGVWTPDIMQLVHADPAFDLPLNATRASPLGSAARRSATPAVQPMRFGDFSKPTMTKAKSKSPEVLKIKNASATTKSVAKTTGPNIEQSAAHQTQDAKATRPPAAARAQASTQLASGVNKNSKEAEIRPEDATAFQASGTNKGDRKAETKSQADIVVQPSGVSKGSDHTKAKPEAGVVDKTTEPKKAETPKTEKKKSAEPRALHDRSVEDDVDWDDEEL
jgi:hypothetical protein